MSTKASEEDTKINLVLPALAKSGWSKDPKLVKFERPVRVDDQFTDGKVILKTKEKRIHRAKPKKADIVLYYKNNYPLAVIEVEAESHTVRYGFQQAKDYAEKLDIRFAYSTNGRGFVEYDFLTGRVREFDMNSFPTREELYERYCENEKIDENVKSIIDQRYYYKEGLKRPRYYQRIAINRTVEYVARLQNNPDLKKRALLVMATGSGKTFTAFQIIYRLHEAGLVKKVLYLVDRNALADQTINNEFQSFKERGILTKVTKKTLDSSYDIYMSLYQQLSGEDNIEPFRQFTRDYFDLIIVDECHRGSARENSKWRDVLNYFDSAIHIGMTATPKETEDVSNSEYFGEPIYTYSLKQGIDDGFLAPYSVRRIKLDLDVEGYTPEPGKRDMYGQEIEQREYTRRDFDRNLIIDGRTEKVAKRITDFLKANDRYSKTIVFCVDTEHAERMATALINENSDMCQIDHRYVMQITGDNIEGKAQLENFLDDNSRYPTIVTTSQLLSTGIDCRMCKVIVFDKEVQSMTEFKQIIGRGSRLEWDRGKRYFTILDFRDVTKKFADKDFDGPASSVYVGPYDKMEPVIEEPEEEPYEEDDLETEEIKQKPRINDVNANIIAEQELLYGPNGELISNHSAYVKATILNKFDSKNKFIDYWNNESKKDLIDSLSTSGVDIDRLKFIYGDDIDVYDIILKVAYGRDLMKPKSERAENVINSEFFEGLTNMQQSVLKEVLNIYTKDDDDVLSIEDNIDIFELPQFRSFGGFTQIIKKVFGDKNKYYEIEEKAIKLLYEDEEDN